MEEPVNRTENRDHAQSGVRIEIMSRAQLVHCRHWRNAFVGKRKDYRFYELVEDTVRQGFDYQYFAIKDEDRDGRPNSDRPISGKSA